MVGYGCLKATALSPAISPLTDPSLYSRSMHLYDLYLEGMEFLPEFPNVIFHGFDVNFYFRKS